MMLLVAVPSLLLSGSYLFLIGALLLISAPMMTNLMQLALSRAREFNADLGAVALTGDSIGLASALKKLERATSGGGFPWVFAGKKKQSVPAMLRTHPPTEERVRRILEAGESLTPQSIPATSPRRLAPQQYPRVRRGPRWHVAGLWY